MSVRWGREIGKIFWDMRWSLLGFAALVVGLHFAFEYGDALFPNRRGWSTTDTVLALVFGGMIAWGYSSELRKRIERLEETVEELKRR